MYINWIIHSDWNSADRMVTTLWYDSDEDDDTSTAYYSYLNNFEYTIYAVNYKLLDCGIIHLLYASQYPAECFHPLSYGAVLFLSPFLRTGETEALKG